jgi:hypothetical protein
MTRSEKACCCRRCCIVATAIMQNTSAYASHFSSISSNGAKGAGSNYTGALGAI